MKKIAAMPGIGPGPKPRVKNSAQISMSTERMKSKKRFISQLVVRFGVIVARRKEGQREGQQRRQERTDESHHQGLEQLYENIRMLPGLVVEPLVDHELRIRHLGIDPVAREHQADREKKSCPQSGDFGS